MRQIIRNFSNRSLVAVALAVTIVSVIAVARLVDNGRADRALSANFGATSPSTNPGQDPGDDAEVLSSPTSNLAASGLLRAANKFMESWLARDLTPSEWHKLLAPQITKSLSSELDGVDPRGVPAKSTISEPSVTFTNKHVAIVNFPVDTGLVRLTLVSDGNRWLIDAVDWDRR